MVYYPSSGHHPLCLQPAQSPIGSNMADVELDQAPVVEVPQEEAAPVQEEALQEETPAAEEAAPAEETPQEAPISEPEAAAEAPSAEAADAQQKHDGHDATPAAQEPAPVDASAAAAAAAAIAARLAQQHGDQYPVSSGAEHAEGNNKRPREDDPVGDIEGGPEKKRASTGMLEQQNGGDAPNPGGPMELLEIPANMVGKLIGRGGETIRNLQLSSDTRIQVDHSGDGDVKRVTISGTSSEAVAKAKREIMEIIQDEETTESMECPAGIVGRIIGRGGETIRALQSASQAHITVDQNFPEGQPRKIVIQGRPEACRRASTMVSELINGEPGSAQAIIQRVCQEYGIGKTHVVFCPKGMVGRIIGRSGETIKQIQRQTGATIQIDQGGDPCRVTIAGQPTAADQAKRLIDDIVAGGDPFRPDMGRPGPGGPGGFPGGPYGGPQFPPAFGGFPPYGGPPPFGGFTPYGPPFGAPFGGPPAGFGGFGGPDPYAQGYGAQPGFGAPAGYGGPSSGGAAPAGGGSSGVWQELHDDQGRPYYYNTQTGVTQWEKPADF